MGPDGHFTLGKGTWAAESRSRVRARTITWQRFRVARVSIRSTSAYRSSQVVKKNKTCQRARGRKVIFRMISRRRAKALIACLCIRESRTSECQGRSAARRSDTGLRTRWAACARGSRRGKAGSIHCVGGLSEAAVDTKFLRQCSYLMKK